MHENINKIKKNTYHLHLSIAHVYYQSINSLIDPFTISHLIILAHPPLWDNYHADYIMHTLIHMITLYLDVFFNHFITSIYISILSLNWYSSLPPPSYCSSTSSTSKISPVLSTHLIYPHQYLMPISVSINDSI